MLRVDHARWDHTVSKELCPPEPRQAKALPAANGDPPISNWYETGDFGPGRLTGSVSMPGVTHTYPLCLVTAASMWLIPVMAGAAPAPQLFFGSLTGETRETRLWGWVRKSDVYFWNSPIAV